ncbi:hypothetical protein [Planococcus salinus]|uniref:Uncharacterized protein n=1 Tax=Planococcus salinus TaxID=1848460 RepID=A0A3M8PBX0_9BACL|nr:hypothetical protein [Planococcus salinus]RNF41218.1 hypothetical protein EEX84_02405 [Planococcus salinus]
MKYKKSIIVSIILICLVIGSFINFKLKELNNFTEPYAKISVAVLEEETAALQEDLFQIIEEKRVEQDTLEDIAQSLESLNGKTRELNGYLNFKRMSDVPEFKFQFEVYREEVLRTANSEELYTGEQIRLGDHEELLNFFREFETRIGKLHMIVAQGVTLENDLNPAYDVDGLLHDYYEEVISAEGAIQ